MHFTVGRGLLYEIVSGIVVVTSVPYEISVGDAPPATESGVFLLCRPTLCVGAAAEKVKAATSM